MNRCGIYLIENITNNKKYVGSTTNLNDRKIRHFSNLKHKRHGNPHLQSAYDKYGQNSFKFYVIIECEESELLELEDYFIVMLHTMDHSFGYNLRGAERQIMTEATKEKLRLANLGKKASEETKLKMSLTRKGKRHSEEAKKNMSLSRKGYKQWWGCSDETKEKIRRYNLGKKYGPVPEDRKEKIRESLKGRKQSPETIAKRIASMKRNREFSVSQK